MNIFFYNFKLAFIYLWIMAKIIWIKLDWIPLVQVIVFWKFVLINIFWINVFLILATNLIYLNKKSCRNLNFWSWRKVHCQLSIVNYCSVWDPTMENKCIWNFFIFLFFLFCYLSRIFHLTHYIRMRNHYLSFNVWL